VKLFQFLVRVVFGISPILLGQTVSGLAKDPGVRVIVREMKFCEGPTSYAPIPGQPSKGDITLRLYLTFSYQNPSLEPLILPLFIRTSADLGAPQQPQRLKMWDKRDRRDPTGVASMPFPAPPYATIIAPGGMTSLDDMIDVPVMSVGKSLLGTSVNLSITRDHGLLPAEIVTVLALKWKEHGLLWTGKQETNALTIALPTAPSTVDCRTDDRF
jgi:hypothetical protein